MLHFINCSGRENHCFSTRYRLRATKLHDDKTASVICAKAHCSPVPSSTCTRQREVPVPHVRRRLSAAANRPGDTNPLSLLKVYPKTCHSMTAFARTIIPLFNQGFVVRRVLLLAVLDLDVQQFGNVRTACDDEPPLPPPFCEAANGENEGMRPFGTTITFAMLERSGLILIFYAVKQRLHIETTGRHRFHSIPANMFPISAGTHLMLYNNGRG